MLQKLRCGELVAISHVNDFGNVLHHINHFGLLVKLQSFLAVIAKIHRFANIKTSRIGWHFAQQHFDEGTFSGTVVAHDTHFFVSGKNVVEMVGNFYVVETFGNIFRFKYFFTDIDSCCR